MRKDWVLFVAGARVGTVLMLVLLAVPSVSAHANSLTDFAVFGSDSVIVGSNMVVQNGLIGSGGPVIVGASFSGPAPIPFTPVSFPTPYAFSAGGPDVYSDGALSPGSYGTLPLQQRQYRLRVVVGNR